MLGSVADRDVVPLMTAKADGGNAPTIGEPGREGAGLDAELERGTKTYLRTNYDEI
jgi:hypothetical protein